MFKHHLSLTERTTKLLISFALCSSGLFCSTLPAYASQAYDDAMHDFQLKRYHAASDEFARVIEKEPSNASAYFYMGRSLEELKDRDNARIMYESCFKLDPFGQSGRQSRNQLMNLANTQATVDHPADGAKVTGDTLRVIDSQAAFLRTIKIQDGNRGAAWAIRSGQLAAYQQNGYYQPTQPRYVRDPNAQLYFNQQQMLNDIKAQVAAGGGNPYTVPGNINGNGALVNPAAANAGYNYPGYNNFGYNNGRRLYDNSNLRALDTAAIRADAGVRATRYQIEATQQAAEVQKSANNLKSLLAEDKHSSGPHLRALGTNLFVRNYSDHDDDNSVVPADPPLELKATAIKLSDLPVGEKAVAKGWR